VKLWQKPELRTATCRILLLNRPRSHGCCAGTVTWLPTRTAHTPSGNCGRGYSRWIRDDTPYLSCHINLAGDLFHQDPQEMVHIEEYVHRFSPSARFIHPHRFEAVKFPLFYRSLFWYEPYAFHVNIKSAHRMLLRHFWEDWMELKDYAAYPTLERYAETRIREEFATSDWEEAEDRCITRTVQDYIPYDQQRFGPYPGTAATIPA